MKAYLIPIYEKIENKYKVRMYWEIEVLSMSADVKHKQIKVKYRKTLIIDNMWVDSAKFGNMTHFISCSYYCYHAEMGCRAQIFMPETHSILCLREDE